MNTINYNKKAVQEGAQAYEDGKTINANPYDSISQAYRQWDRGFLTQRVRNILPEPVAVVVEPEPAPKKKNAPRKTAPKTTATTAKKTVVKAASKAAPNKAVAKKTTVPKAKAVAKAK